MNRRNQLRRAALLLALLVLAAIVTGVAASATKTAIPEKMAGKWVFGDGKVMVVGPRGKVEIRQGGWYRASFSHVTTHEKHGWDEWYGRLSVNGIRSCSGTGRYRWTVSHQPFQRGVFRLTKIHDACKP